MWRLHNAFKAATAAQGVDMTTVLQQFIENYSRARSAPKAKDGAHEARRPTTLYLVEARTDTIPERVSHVPQKPLAARG